MSILTSRPPEWLSDVRQVDEDSLLSLADRLPGEAAEALLELATGGRPIPPEPTVPVMNPFEHPDAQRRFRVMSNVEELQRALEFPWDRWSVFLHPEQRQLVERHYTGPARVSGSAGTGKTIVALHRAVFLARANQNARVLLTTFSHMLANALRTQIRRLISNEPSRAWRSDWVERAKSIRSTLPESASTSPTSGRSIWHRQRSSTSCCGPPVNVERATSSVGGSC